MDINNIYIEEKEDVISRAKRLYRSDAILGISSYRFSGKFSNAQFRIGSRRSVRTYHTMTLTHTLFYPFKTIYTNIS